MFRVSKHDKVEEYYRGLASESKNAVMRTHRGVDIRQAQYYCWTIRVAKYL